MNALFFFLQNVHHAGQLMPGEEQEDIVMTSTPFGLSNTVCPITGKFVTELAEPVRRLDLYLFQNFESCFTNL